jgi:hypothetical protein
MLNEISSDHNLSMSWVAVLRVKPCAAELAFRLTCIITIHCNMFFFFLGARLNGFFINKIAINIKEHVTRVGATINKVQLGQRLKKH